MLIILKEYFTLAVGNFLKKTCLLVVLLVFIGFSASAEDIANEIGGKNGHHVSLGLSFGLLSGTSEEIVYRNSSANNYLSQLNWELNPLLYVGVDAGYGWQSQAVPESVFGKILSGFFVDVFFKYGLPGDTGVMEDRDWIRQPTWVVSHYSLHDNRTDIAMLAGLDVGRSFKLWNEFRLGAFLSYNVMYYSFSARGGTFLYPELDGGHFFDPSQETVVTYKQFWQIFSPGISFYGEFNRYFDIELFFRISPLVTVSSFDEHLVRTLQIINDPMPFGLYIEPGFIFTFKPASKFMLSLSLNHRSIGGNRGDSRYRYPDNSNTYTNVGGADYSAFDIGLTVKYRIGE